MLENLLKKRWFPQTVRIACLALLISLMLVLFYKSFSLFNLTFTASLAMFVIWTVWWPVLYSALFFSGRAWCGFFCPLTLIFDAGNYISKGKTLNILKWSFIAYPVFFLVVFFEQVSGMFLSATTTLMFFSAVLITAFVFGLVFSRYTFCWLVCPIGTLLGTFSRLSMAGIRTINSLCRKCQTRECIRGSDKADACPVFINVPLNASNKSCLVCTNCIKNCPHNSAQLRFTGPGKEIQLGKQFRLCESLFIISLLGFTMTITTNGTQLLRKFFLGFEFKGVLLRGIDFITAIGIFLLAYTAVSVVASRLGRKPVKPTITRMGYAYLPLVFSIMTFSVIFGFLSVQMRLSETSVAFAKYLFIITGSIWSLVLLFKMAGLLEGVLHGAVISMIAFFWIFALIPGPLSIVASAENVVEILPGETVQMDAFSMGYNPAVLIAKKNIPVVLNITNFDINHAFDIDEFDTHIILSGGGIIRVQFTPDKTGEFKFYCSIPGHEEAGMKGKLIVKEA